MSANVRVWLLLGRFPGDDEPIVVGAVDETVWEHWEEAEEQDWLKEMKRRFGLDPTDLEWKTAWAEFAPQDLVEAFKTPIVQGVVTADEFAERLAEGTAS